MKERYVYRYLRDTPFDRRYDKITLEKYQIITTTFEHLIHLSLHKEEAHLFIQISQIIYKKEVSSWSILES